jgi:hypothetical protein
MGEGAQEWFESKAKEGGKEEMAEGEGERGSVAVWDFSLSGGIS